MFGRFLFIFVNFIEIINVVFGCLPFGLSPYGSSFNSNPLYTGYNGYRYADESRERSPTIPPIAHVFSHDKTITTNQLSKLNCQEFDGNCLWSNTIDDKLDWSVRISSLEAERWILELEAANEPAPGSAVLISPRSNGWEAGKLVSDEIPCAIESLKLTATAWLSRADTPHEQPSLHVCAQSAHTTNNAQTCVLFKVKNGKPTSVNVPPPSDPLSPMRIVIIGDNFIADEGGAIFLQDIIISGQATCSLTPINNSEDLLVVSDVERSRSDSSSLRWRNVNTKIKSNMNDDNEEPAKEVCRTLSCKPHGSKCLWRSESAGWQTSNPGRKTNPLTGIGQPPLNFNEFLVAPLDGHTKYRMVSSTINVPIRLNEPIYFCFYEYFATDGARLALCRDRVGLECFYSRSSIFIGDRLKNTRQWDLKCVELPVGLYEVNVFAESHGSNKGELGFLPINVASDNKGKYSYC